MKIKMPKTMTIRDLMEKFPERLDTPIFFYVDECAHGYIPLDGDHAHAYEDNLGDCIDELDVDIITISINCWWESETE